MIAAVSEGLQRAGVTYTLPPSKDGGPGDPGQLAALKARAAGVGGTAGTDGTGTSGSNEDHPMGNNATAAAANLLLIS